jgi:outer membrane protein assembly factor BamB
MLEASPVLALRALGPGALVATLLTATPAAAQWPQWGGPDRNFSVASVPLASSWPEAGPPTLWRRPLGHGDSAIVADAERLYTMYREDGREVIVALDRETGKTLWEHSDVTPLWEGFRGNNGEGPRATPAVAGERVCAIGVGARSTCLDRTTGERLWSRDLWEHYDVDPSRYGPADRGYGASPLIDGDRLYAVAGGPGHAVTALDVATGDVIWASLDHEISYASPILIEVGGQKQVVFFMADRVVGVAAADGRQQWEHPHVTDYSVNATTPLWLPERRILFVSSAYDTGSRALRLTGRDGGTDVEELWLERKLQIMHGTAVSVGDLIWGSSGGFGPAFLVAVRAETGEEVERVRGFAKANLIASGERLVLLDETGVLGLVGVAGGEARVLAEWPLLSPKAWAAPTLVGSVFYARDREEIVAVDLGIH